MFNNAKVQIQNSELTIENTNTRLFVLERSIILEQLSSMTIAELLEIPEWENSKMLGIQSSAFSFNQKINFFIDLSDLDKTLKTKFEVLQEIRNKFAHILKVNSFENYKKLSKNCEANCKKLEKWYLDTIEEFKGNNELKFKLLFNELYRELSEYTIQTTIKFAEKKGHAAGRLSFIKDYMEELEKIVLQLPNGDELKNFALDKVNEKNAQKVALPNKVD